MKREAPSGIEDPSRAGLSARTRHRCKTVKEVLIWKGAQDPKAGPGSRAKIAKNSSERLFGNGDLIRQEASGWSDGSPTTRGSSRRDTCSLLDGERPKGGRQAGLPRRHARVMGPGGAPASRSTSSASWQALRALPRRQPWSPHATASQPGENREQKHARRHIPFSSRRQRAKALFYLIG